jgi:dolichol-phosphate mannosyltransferase
VYNEHKYVGPVLDKIKRFHGDILVVDDGSTDGTADLIAGRGDIHSLRHPVNRGYGQSLIDAFAWAEAKGYDWVITIDCDEQHEPERIPDFIREIETDRWDVISGSRYLAPSCEDDLPPADRRSINGTITKVLNEKLGLGITDAFCGYKAQRVCAMKRLALDEPGYAFPMQFWPRAVRQGLRITEIPVRLIYNDPTRHFGGLLDDANVRLRHYMEVLDREVRRGTDVTPLDVTAECTPSSCGCGK